MGVEDRIPAAAMQHANTVYLRNIAFSHGTRHVSSSRLSYYMFSSILHDKIKGNQRGPFNTLNDLGDRETRCDRFEKVFLGTFKARGCDAAAIV